jgi:dienelactone hydrolase
MRLPVTLLAVVFLPLTMMSAALPPPAELPARPEPPDLLTMLNGDRVANKADWIERRAPELRLLVQHYEYGLMPKKPERMEAKLIREDKQALNGKATLREFDVHCTHPDARIHLMVVVPNQRTKPAPCFLGLNFSGNYALLNDPKIQMPQGYVSDKYAGAPANRAGEAGRGKQLDTWAIEQSVDRGYAVASFYNGDVISDKAELAKEQLKKFVPPGKSADDPDATATIAAWAWGFSRMIDHLVTDPDIDAKRIAVVGHSRNGKTALLAAAMDERIALAIPSQAGCGGTAPCRMEPTLAELKSNGRPTAETVAVINKSFPHWFCGNFKQFNEAVEKLPFDQHALIALCAPRPVLVSNATEDLWANPAGQFQMLRAADPVYRLVAGDGCDAKAMPPVGQLGDTRLGYYIRAGKHSMTTEDWKVWLDYADKWLK